MSPDHNSQQDGINVGETFRNALSFLSYWQQNGYELVKLDLTAEEPADVQELIEKHDQLRETLEPSAEWIASITDEGNGVAHALWSHPHHLDLDHWDVSRRWPARIHIEDVILSSSEDRRRLAGYLTYGQHPQLRGFDGSYRSTFGVSEKDVESVWSALAARVADEDRYSLWHRLLGGETIEVRGIRLDPPPHLGVHWLVDDYGDAEHDDPDQSLAAAIAERSARHPR